MKSKSLLIGLAAILLALWATHYFSGTKTTPEPSLNHIAEVDAEVKEEPAPTVKTSPRAVPTPMTEPKTDVDPEAALFGAMLEQVEKTANDEAWRMAISERYMDEFDRRNEGNRRPALLTLLREIKPLRDEQQLFALSVLDRLAPIEIAPDLIAWYDETDNTNAREFIFEILLAARHNYKDYGIRGDYSTEEYAVDDFLLYVNSTQTDELESDSLIRQVTGESEKEFEAIRGHAD